MGSIYRFVIADKWIIGSSIVPEKRKNYHLYQLKRGEHDNDYLQKLFNKYGEENCHFEILQEEIPDNILRYAEDVWIGALCSKVFDKRGGVNIIDGSRLIFTEDIIRKKSEAQKLYMNSLTDEEWRDRMSKMKKSKEGKWKEIGKSISNGKKGKNTEWDNYQSIPVIQLTLDNTPIKLWSCAYQAERENGYISTMISRICKSSTSKPYKNFRWRCATTEEVIIYDNLKFVDVPKCIKGKMNAPVLEIDRDGNIVKEWRNGTEAANFYKVHSARVSVAIKRGRKINGNYFQFKT